MSAPTHCQLCGDALQHGYEVFGDVGETLCRSCWWLREATHEMRAITIEDKARYLYWTKVPREYDQDTPSPDDGLPF